jgi:hypothetical protein
VQGRDAAGVEVKKHNAQRRQAAQGIEKMQTSGKGQLRAAAQKEAPRRGSAAWAGGDGRNFPKVECINLQEDTAS